VVFWYDFSDASKKGALEELPLANSK